MQSLQRKYLGALCALGMVGLAFTASANAGVMTFSDLAYNGGSDIPTTPLSLVGLPSGVTATFTDFRTHNATDLADHTGDPANVYIWQLSDSLTTINFNATVEVPSLYIYVDSWCPNPSTIYGYANGVQVWAGSVAYTDTGYDQITAGAGIDIDQLRWAAKWARVDDISVNLVHFNSSVGTWSLNGSGEWSTAGNWNGGNVPTSATSQATFGSAITANQTVLVNADATVGVLNFDNPGSSYFIQGPAGLSVNNGASNAEINVLQGTHVLTPGTLNISSNTSINLSSGTNLTIGGYIGGMVVGAGNEVTKTGAGNLNVVGMVKLGAGGSFNLAAAPSIALASALTTDGVSGSGSLDLTNNKAIIHGGSLSAVESQIVSGTITSSLAGTSGNANVMAVGSLTGTDYLALTGSTFGGQAVVASDILVGLTYAGDINLDGTVSVADLASITLGGAHWVNGDFNHDGTVTFADVALADAAYKLQSGSVADAVVAADALKFGAAFEAAYQAALLGGAPGAVPEPASLALLGLGAVALLKRRR